MGLENIFFIGTKKRKRLNHSCVERGACACLGTLMSETIQNSKGQKNCNLWAIPEGIPWPQRMDVVHLGPSKTSVRTVECR